ncbi:outer membrane protein transport protein [Thiobacillus sp.]|uniref:outer membrane protein transport protein n=1 Tax=Thiobacillus sp. TaxID=924 RepID=UPI0025F5B242|nr:outer membrane protein transport protein [Thiobacillus sp.]
MASITFWVAKYLFQLDFDFNKILGGVMRFSLKYVALVISCMATFPAHATNGYFLPGFGFRSQGMGGVGIAYGRDSLSTAANPANAVNTGMRGDLGFGVFNPERHATVGVPAGGGTAFGFSGNTESDAKYFILPEMGFSMPLDDKWHVALAVVGNGGMNTTYPENFFSFFGDPPKDAKIGVDMMQLLVPITAAYKVNENHSIGASLVLAETRFRAYGLEAFRNFDKDLGFAISADPDHLTGQGFDYSYGAGVRLGWQGEFLDDRLTLGLTYATKTYMTKFDKYRGLFAEQGGFDIPENYGIGIAVKPVKGLIVAADVLRINYADVPSIGNPGMTNIAGTLGVPSLATGTNPNQYELGNDQGMGFGWTNQTVYKFGVQYGVNNRLQVRGGYNYGKSPIPNNQLTFNLLAPATVEKHYSLGFTYKANENLEVTGTYMYAASHSQSGCKNNIVNCVEFDMHQNVFAMSLGWVLDPGPGELDEYGDSDWGGINFDGWYAGLGIGQSHYRDLASSIDSAAASVGATSTTSASPLSEGWKVYGGYQFNKYLALEGGYTNLNDAHANTTITAPSAGTIRTNVATDAWSLAAVGTYPITDKFSLMGKVGAAYVLTEITASATGSGSGTTASVAVGDDSYRPVYGLGASYALLDNLNLRAEYERFDLKDINIDLITAGVAMKF